MKYKSLYTLRENLKTENTVKQVHELYTQYDLCKITPTQFRERLEDDLHVKPTPEFDEIVKRAGGDKKSFKNIINSLHVYDKKVEVPQVKIDMKHFHPRYKRLPEQTIQHDKDEVQESINQYARGELDTKSFEDTLKTHNINPYTIEIDKVIRQVKSGGQVSYAALNGAVHRFGNTKEVVDYSKYKVNDTIGKHNSESNSDFSESKFSIGVSKHALNDVKFLAKKKNFQDKEARSHTENFNWEGNIQEDFEKQVYDMKKPVEKQGVNDDKSKKNKSSFKFTYSGAETGDEQKFSKMNNNIIVRSNVNKNVDTKASVGLKRIPKGKSSSLFNVSRDFPMSTTFSTARV